MNFLFLTPATLHYATPVRCATPIELVCHTSLNPLYDVKQGGDRGLEDGVVTTPSPMHSHLGEY